MKKKFKNHLKSHKGIADKTEGAIAVIAALFVLFSAMMSPNLSITISLIFIILLAVYKFLRR